ncbi:three-Cys-motif partner protein TcmP [Methylobacterium sp. E-016]|uniref:three-Cys-motif partner protein TcmP n=1 Tax=Methylobacterium sp. E-016 TaxID=2836556 RepID=UPI001FBA28B8|nr:three-Cys-motif partner protein TcmP [Methylobacterium sp. E-016]MCJ2075396.1 three-Cys-motif partner protein TcmP [Methylobacterium sp. E-016]
MTKKPKDGVGPWAKEKLDALGDYLGFYTKVLKNQSWWCKGTIYVDAFAGPGRSKVRTKEKPAVEAGLFDVEPTADVEAVEYLKGSPRVALDIADPFSRYVFIERNPERIAELRALAEEYGDTRRIVVREGDAATELQGILDSGINWKHHRAVIFVDPFGMHIPWATFEALAATKAIEVFVNFPLGMAIQRFLVRTGEIPANWRETLNVFFGSPDWWDHAYEERDGLFGTETLKLADSGLRLLDWYRGRLETLFGHVSPGRLIRNTQGGHLYYLVWAGPNKKGLDGAKHILSKGDRVVGAQRASRTRSNG